METMKIPTLDLELDTDADTKLCSLTRSSIDHLITCYQMVDNFLKRRGGVARGQHS